MQLSSRRQFLSCLSALGAVLVGITNIRVSHGEEALESVWGKPQIKRSELKSIVDNYVDRISASTKTGYELTWPEKEKLAEDLMNDLEQQTSDIYTFIDP